MAAFFAFLNRSSLRAIYRLKVVSESHDASKIHQLRHLTSCTSARTPKRQVHKHTSRCLPSPSSWHVHYLRHISTTSVLSDEFRVVKCPQLAESLSEGDIRWNKAVGDTVQEDEVICEVETDKTSVPIHAPAAGVVAELLVEDGATIQPGKEIMKLKVGAGGGAASAAPPQAAAAAPAAPSPPAAAAASGAGEVRTVKCPQLAESLSEGDIRWSKAVGDTVAEDEVICEVETDKTSVPIHAPAGGVILEILAADGTTVQPGMDIFRLQVGGAGGAPAAARPAAAPAAPAPTPVTSTPPPAASSGPIPTTPPPTPAMPTGPMASIPVSSIQVPGPAAQAAAAAATAAAPVGARTEQRVKMNRMRQRIAQRLKDAQNVYAMLTTFNEVDMTNVIQMRNKYKDTFAKKHGVKLGFMSPFVKAAAFALQDQPIVNAVIDEQEIVYRDYIDISVAVSTPKGLVVPVIRNCERMNYADIEKAIFELGEKARTGSLAIEDMDGGTFTISNGGVFGSMFGTPIINPPQSAILGMHAIFERPVAISGKVEIRPMMYICLTYDHRLIDGREAVTFLKKVKSAVEDPNVLVLDV
ncbi:dihydrolipoyllysine-residue succinyltransferase component of 2-oxoglutarate dehydrogenase complex, mitochondrial [Dermacentor andersoni]|uniref:dihydrolipoyllysine-residue succinyltransferase component of 2-oxoglutarate dehydrogenase complex, mitochondrial n=1 Tax=Dermacentor andersoni TaxID=34620 RepID=UPI002155E109|nr:dihydrolipoyllysine-residue succinyltransferase component of 2-oxoglutarate dehydrogenase complex, mitochondrial-like [Dermacentor andersoni]